MSLREEQCQKVCRILDDVLANRPTERDSLIVAVRKAFAEPKRGEWTYQNGMIICDQCLRAIRSIDHDGLLNFCPNCGADMREVTT